MKITTIKNHKSKIKNPSGFTLMEIGVAMAILAVAMMLVLQISFWSMRERVRASTQHVAIEQAANVLEAARSVPWESLTSEWAEAQRIPEDLADLFPEGRLSVKVEPLESQPLTKRVSVEIRWMLVEEVAARPVRMIGFVSARCTAKGGEQ